MTDTEKKKKSPPNKTNLGSRMGSLHRKPCRGMPTAPFNLDDEASAPSPSITRFAAPSFWANQARARNLTLESLDRFADIFNGRVHKQDSKFAFRKELDCGDLGRPVIDTTSWSGLIVDHPSDTDIFYGFCAGVVGVSEMCGMTGGLAAAYGDDAYQPAIALAKHFDLELPRLPEILEGMPPVQISQVSFDRHSIVGALVCDLVVYGHDHPKVPPETESFNPHRFDLS